MKRALLVHGLGSSPAGWWRVRGWLEDAGWQIETVALLGHAGRGAASEYSIDAYVADVRDATAALVLGGDPDVYTMLEPADGYEVGEDAAELEYRIVPGAGHSPHRDAPDATRELLFECLDR